MRTLTEEKLHPTVREFKTFLNKHPKLIEMVRYKGRSWQEYYEKWVLLGEDDPFWDSYKETTETKEGGKKTEKQSELFKRLLKLAENIDLEKIQRQAHQLSNTIHTVQQVIGQFQETKNDLESERGSDDWLRD
ncbi:MAG TPA: spore coat protein YlbD [Bacillota bacterium]|nr:spore coat protein YlbD [Bacillota bacterium]